MTEVTFKNRKLNKKKLLSFGFETAGNGYTYHTDLADAQLKLTVKIDHEEKIYTEVVDSSSKDEYVLHLVAGAAGPFVGQVKSEYETVLEEIAEKCFDTQIFKSRQAKEVIAYVRDTYGDEPEYLWRKFSDNAVVRRKDTQKWYAVLLTVSRRKLGFDSDETVEILDLRMIPEDIEKQTDGVKILPGYHMNKKHWVTICLDGSVPIDDICRRTDESYLLAIK
ncbi:MAG: MmcQ/YjbR family DNA-binding protein [Roseburia sp.]|nr:MmcQ/YjbR family DNA-binding protein [Roseburia sp.]